MHDPTLHRPRPASGRPWPGVHRPLPSLVAALLLLAGLVLAPVPAAKASDWAGPSSGFEGAGSLAEWVVWTQGGAGPIQVAPAAALEGAAGLEVGLAGGGLALAIRDVVPSRDPFLGGEGASVSFLWGPGTASVPEGQAVGIAGLRNTDLKLLGWVRVRPAGGGWEVSAVAIPDDATPVVTPWKRLRGVPVRLRLEWWAREGVWGGGGLRLWADNEVVGELSGLVNRDRGWAGELLMGVVTKAPAGSSGSFHYDAVTAFVRPWTGALPPGVHGCDVTYFFPFEGAAELDGWNTWWQNGGNVEVTPAAALVGSQGLAATMDAGWTVARHDLFPADPDGSIPTADEVQVDFYFSPGTAYLPEDSGHGILALRALDGKIVARIHVRRMPDRWDASLVVTQADGTLAISPWAALPAWVTRMRLEWWARPLAEGGGGAQLWFNNVLGTELRGLDNRHWQPMKLQLGLITGVTPTSQGTFHFDRLQICPVRWSD